jgi:UDP-perosamine 4-acetyltransferase
MKRVVGLGAGGHAKVLIDILHQSGEYDVIGLLDPDKAGQVLGGVLVLGNDERLAQIREDGVTCAFIGVGGVGDNSLRTTLYQKALAAGFTVVNAIHPTAILAPSVQLGQGVAIMAGAIVNADAIISDNVIINTGAIVEHDCAIGAHVHISPGAILSGGVRVGESAHIGAGATVRQCITIGAEAIIGAGAVVIRDTPPNTVSIGVPARVIKFKKKDPWRPFNGS